MAKQRVALLGIGTMGRGMAANLLKAGFPLTVYNRTREKAEPLAAQGATIANTPAEAAKGADVVISILADDTASRAAWLGDRRRTRGNVLRQHCRRVRHALARAGSPNSMRRQRPAASASSKLPSPAAAHRQRQAS